jgi:RNA polymerase sigma-70 factor, ECF subfamily
MPPLRINCGSSASSKTVDLLSASTEPQIAQAVAEFKAGRRRDENFRFIMEAYYVSVLRYVRRRWAQKDEDAEDLTQEIFLKVYRSLEDLTTPSKFRGWLFTIAHNAGVNWLFRHLEEEKLRELAPDSEDGNQVSRIDRAADPRSDALTGLVEREVSRALNAAIQALPPKMRICAELRLQRGYHYQQIADSQAVSIQTVKAHLFQAKARIRDYLTRNSSDSRSGN